MGRLIERQAFYGDDPTENARWYAPSAGYSRSLSVSWDVAFPHVVRIHDKILLGEGEAFERRRQIRSWIERNLPCTVIIAHENLSYRYYFASDRANDYVPLEAIRERQHGYHQFLFEQIDDATLFSLNFGEWVTLKPSRDHPDYPESEGYIRFVPGFA